MADDINFSDLNKFLKDFVASNKEAQSSLSGYLETQTKLNSQLNELNFKKKLANQLEKEILALQRKGGSNLNNLTATEKKRLSVLKEALDTTIEKNKHLEIEVELLKKSLSVSNLMISSVNTVGSGFKKISGYLYSQKTDLLESLKAVRLSEKNMGLLKSQTAGYRDNLYKASLYTSDLGIDVKGLAKIQTSYSDELERNVLLSQEQLKAISEISSGTNMSVEAAGAFAGKMDMFGVSAEKSASLVDDITRSSAKMGINSSKVLAKLENSLKMANKYHFKDGVKGMAEMAKMSAKFKIEMDSIGGMADKLFDPEGAIEMAGQLQVLGGAWSQIADPFNLMFKARNDMAGLQKDVIKAASGVAVFNDKTGEFEISALELHRMRSAAEMTGISMNELAESAKEVAKQGKIKMQIRGGLTDEMKEFVAASAVIGKDGKATISIDGKDVDVKQLGGYTKRLEAIMKDKTTLEQKAKQAQTFDEKLDNLLTKGKSALLPLIEKIDGTFGPMIDNFTTWLNDEGGLKVIGSAIDSVGKIVGKFGDWLKDSPLQNALITLGSGVALKGLWDFGQWYANGLALGKGFNTIANIGDSSSLLSSGPGSRKGGLGGAMSDVGKAFGRSGARGGTGRYLMRAGGKLLKGGGAAALGGLALDGIRSSGMVDEGSDWDKGLNVGAKALEWGGTGALLGSVIPGIGTGIGGAIGGVLGAGYGAYDSYFRPQKTNDGIAKPGNGPFTVTDRFGAMAVTNSKDGLVATPNIGNSNSKVSSTKDKPVVVTFDKPLEIKGSIQLNGFGKTADIDLNNPLILRELTKLIQEQLSKNISGGKLSSNPI